MSRWALTGMCKEQVADTFLSGLEGAAQSCINSLPSLNGAPEATAITDQLNKCCPVIKKVRAIHCPKVLRKFVRHSLHQYLILVG